MATFSVRVCFACVIHACKSAANPLLDLNLACHLHGCFCGGSNFRKARVELYSDMFKAVLVPLSGTSACVIFDKVA